MKNEKENLRKVSHSPSNEENQIFRNIFPQRKQEHGTENHKTVVKQTKMAQIDEEVYHVLGSEESI